MNFFLTLNQIAILFSIVLIGYIVGKAGLVSEGFRRELSSFLTAVPLPCMIFNSMNMAFSKEKATQTFMIMGICLAILGFSAVAGKYLTKLLKITDIKQIPVFRFAFSFSNFGFMGLPVCNALFGQEGVFFCAIYGIPLNAAFFLYGNWLFSMASGKKERFSFKKLITPTNIASLIGLMVFFFSIKVPSTIASITEMLGAVTTPMAMIIVGLLLSTGSIKQAFSNKKAFIYSAFRLIIFPLAVLGALKLCGASGMVLAIPFIITAMPSVSNMPVLSEYHGADSYLAAQLIFVSTLLSILTISLMAPLVM